MITPATIVETEDGKKARTGKVRGLFKPESSLSTFGASTVPELFVQSPALESGIIPPTANNPFVTSVTGYSSPSKATSTWKKSISGIGFVGLLAICLGIIDCTIVAIEWTAICEEEKRVAQNLQDFTQDVWSGETFFTAVLKGQLKQRLQFDVFVILIGTFVIAYDLRRYQHVGSVS